MRHFLRHSLVIAGKDLRLELRSKERVVSMLTFAVLVAVVFNFATDPTLPERPISAMIWVTVLFVGMLGLGRSFSQEKEQEALVGILLTPIDRGALYFGKFLANLAVLLLGVAAIYAVYALFFTVSFARGASGFVLLTVLASIGFMALGTLFSAIAASTRLGDTLLPIVLLPLMIPVVIFAAGGTQRLLSGRPLEEIASSIRMLAAFDLIFLLVATLIFEWVVQE
jgi:heme exporter protein B